MTIGFNSPCCWGLQDNKGTPLTNVADVMMEVDAGTVANAPIVAAEISSILTNDTLAVRS